MVHAMITEKSLVLYKNRPAVVSAVGEKLSIALSGGESVKVREKDVELLHPGPAGKPDGLETADPKGDVAGAWELLLGTTVPLSELAELAYGAFTPETAWAAWLQVKDGLRFSGTPAAITAKSEAEVATESARRTEKEREGAEREDFLKRLAAGTILLPEDGRRLQDVEALALGKTDKSRTLKEAGKNETPVDAHKLLLSVGYWGPEVNPHPSRFGKPLASAKEPLAALKEEERLDLTGMRSFAIDNAWSADPDDALSIDGSALWVHIADPAAVIQPDDPADREARGLGETLYLPEGSYRMLAEEALERFALGLTETSPALSFKLTLNEQAEIVSTEIHKTLVRVERLTYQEADARAAEPDLANLFARSRALYARRLAAGAVVIELPEVHITARDGRVEISPLAPSAAADMVRECMLAAGIGTARWAIRNRVPFPFVAQELGDLPAQSLPGLAGSYQLRRCMRPRRLSAVPGEHAGLGLPEYTQVTSPLRRYTDLVAHQQIRAFLDGRAVQSAEEVLARIAAGEAAAQAAVQAERASRAHWTMVYLAAAKGTTFDAVVVDKKGNRATVIIPSLALESSIAVRGDVELNQTIRVSVGLVKIPELEASFTLVAE